MQGRGVGAVSALVVGLVAVVAAYSAGVIVRRMWSHRALDIPTARSSHVRPVTRLGGLAVALGLTLGTAAAALPVRAALALLVAAAVAGSVGFLEDVRGLSVRARLSGQALAAVAAGLALFAGRQPWYVMLLTVLWVIVLTNELNFMDGIDGLAGFQLAVAGAAWIVIGVLEDAILVQRAGAVALGCSAGFLAHNFPRARVFMGDSGAYATGAWLAVAAAIAVNAGIPLVAMLAALGLTGFDTTWTLVRRAVRKENVLEPHQDHFYQSLVLGGWSHVEATAFSAAMMVGMAAAGLLALSGKLEGILAALGAGAAVAAVYGTVATRVGRSRPVAAPHGGR